MIRLILLLFSVHLAAPDAFIPRQTVDVLGKWKADWSLIYGGMTSAEKGKFDALPEPAKTRVRNSFSSRSYEFKVNNTVEISWQSNVGSKVVTGTWNMSGTSLTITTNGSAKSYTVTGQANIVNLAVPETSPGSIISTLVLIKQ